MTVAVKNLLVELFVEELPPKALKKLGEAFANGVAASLKAQRLAAADAVVTPYASPRRMGVHVSDVLAVSPPTRRRDKLMPASVGWTDSGATPALAKRLIKDYGYHDAVNWSALMAEGRIVREFDGKSDMLYHDQTAAGRPIETGLQRALDETLAKLPIPKLMSYQLEAGIDVRPGWTTVHFVRPAHGLVALHGADVVPITALGLVAGRATQGHRFEASVDPVVLLDADSYAQQLNDEGAVIASFAARRAEIVRQLHAKASAQGLKPIDDEALLDEVSGLVERPNVLLCQFDPQFLAVPPECLILTMKANQKYFPLLDAAGQLTQKFLVVSNIRPADASKVIAGNERVVRPRLADAKFFFDQDRKKTLESRAPQLDRVVYHGKLGSQGARAQRVRAIAHAIVGQLSAATVPFTALARDQFEVLDSKVQQAARLAKTDLLTDMVGEFPELQGVMGGYYARHEGLRDGVAIAIEDHYKPRFAGDSLPRNHTGTVLALADKLETLVGMFGIGQLPTGDKDPFALRRHALGILRILMEKNLALALPDLVDAARASFAEGQLSHADAREALLSFVHERLIGLLREQGWSAQEVDAVTALRPGWGQIAQRLAAVRAFTALPEAAALAAANKRVGNILKKSPGNYGAGVNEGLLAEPAERALFDTLKVVGFEAAALFQETHFERSLTVLASLRKPVDDFFEAVMVNAEDEALRVNRLTLLTKLHAAMNHVADLSRLAS